MVKFIIQKKKHISYSNNKKFNLLSKSSELILWCPVLVLVLDILGFVGKVAAPLVGQLIVEMAGGFFLFFYFLLFFHFPCSFGPSVTNRNSDVVLPGGWLVSSIWFLLSIGRLLLGLR
jgi:hypothetical protein